MGLVISGSGPSSLESRYIVGFWFSRKFLLSDLIDQEWTFALEFSLSRGCYLVHPFDGDGFLLLLCHHRSEFWRECCFEQVHLEEVDPHGIILSQKPPESCVRDSSIDVIMWVRNFGVILIEALPDDSGIPGDAGEQFIGHFV